MSNTQNKKGEHTPRRRFFIKTGEIVGSLGILLAGGALNTQNAQASTQKVQAGALQTHAQIRVNAKAKLAYAQTKHASAQTPGNVPLYCCGGNPCPQYICPTGTTYAGYCWVCTQGATFVCQDCVKNGMLYCTYPEEQGICC